jgi:hypothetical protein
MAGTSGEHFKKHYVACAQQARSLLKFLLFGNPSFPLLRWTRLKQALFILLCFQLCAQQGGHFVCKVVRIIAE